MVFNSWEERTDFLLQLQTDVCKKFDKRTFNVFVFGSFLTEAYKPGISDIDLAVYSNDCDLTRKIIWYLSDYLQERAIPNDILLIDTEQREAFINLEPLRWNVSFTDYFPEDLKIYEMQLMKRLIYRNEELRMIPACIRGKL